MNGSFVAFNSVTGYTAISGTIIYTDSASATLRTIEDSHIAGDGEILTISIQADGIAGGIAVSFPTVDALKTVVGNGAGIRYADGKAAADDVFEGTIGNADALALAEKHGAAVARAGTVHGSTATAVESQVIYFDASVKNTPIAVVPSEHTRIDVHRGGGGGLASTDPIRAGTARAG